MHNSQFIDEFLKMSKDDPPTTFLLTILDWLGRTPEPTKEQIAELRENIHNFLFSKSIEK